MSYFTPKEKEDIVNRLRTLYSVRDSQLPEAHALRDDDSIIVHEEDGTEKRVKLKDLAKNYSKILWESDVTYTVQTNIDDATVTIGVDGADAETTSNVTCAAGSTLTITVSADGYTTQSFNLVACYDYTLYVNLTASAIVVFSVEDSDNEDIENAKVLWRKNGIGPWHEISADEDDSSDSDDSDSDEENTYTLELCDEDYIEYKAVAYGYEDSTSAFVTLSSDETQSITINLNATGLNCYLASNVSVSASGGRVALIIETLGKDVPVEIESSEDWLVPRYDKMMIRADVPEKLRRCILTIAASDEDNERTATVTVSNAVTGDEYTITVTQKGAE